MRSLCICSEISRTKWGIKTSDCIYYLKHPALINVEDNKNYVKILLIYELKNQTDRSDHFDYLLIHISCTLFEIINQY